MKLKVTRRALTQRINRALAHEGKKLINRRGTCDWCVVRNDRVVDQYPTDKLGVLARELGVLAAWERLDEEKDPTVKLGQ